MNPLNYASLEASKRLLEEGVALETECFWFVSPVSARTKIINYKPTESEMNQYIKEIYVIPCPSMAEVWRELPGQEHTVRYGAYLELSKTFGIETGEITYAAYMRDGIASCDYANCNPTDTIIDLLIWVRKVNT